MGEESTFDIERTVAEAAGALFADPAARADILGRIVNLGLETVSDSDFAGILVATTDGIETAAATAEVVAGLHRLQIEAHQGPSFDAVQLQSACYVTDLATDERWPRFAKGALELGIRSILAYPLTSAGRPSALDLYAELPMAFGAAGRARGLLMAIFAGLAMDAADTQAQSERREVNLRAALRSRELIGQAQGILMEREKISGDQAFALLRDSSQHLNMKLQEVARNLIETGETPPTDVGRRGLT